MKYLIQLAQTHENFRLAELRALADLYKVDVDLESAHNRDYPFMVVDLRNDQDAYKLIHRSILAKGIYELYGEGDNLEQVHEQVKADPSKYQKYVENTTFKFTFSGYQNSRVKSDQLEVINSFSYMALKGPINLKSPQQTFTVLEYYTMKNFQEPNTIPDKIYFGRLITESSRSQIDKFDLKKRKYIGTTSFEAELALVTCNMAHCVAGGLVYDPFAGTGSFMVSAAHFGCLTLGSDIDVRPLKGKGHTNIDANFKQYGLSKFFIDVATIDFTHNPLRNDLLLDAIICDPPYGVREGLKVLGSESNKTEIVLIDGVEAHKRQDYIPPKKAYPFANLLNDIINFAALHLREGGRLCIWMPTANEDLGKENAIPQHESLLLVDVCEQQFNKWSRRLLTYQRRPVGEVGVSNVVLKDGVEFREKYYKGFGKIP